MRATVVKPQGDARKGGAERSGRQTRDHRNTNRQRGRVRAASVLANAKPEAHQDASSRAGWHAGKVQVLTRGDLCAERRGEVSRDHSSEDVRRKAGMSEGSKHKQHGLTERLALKARDPWNARSGPERTASADRHEAEQPVKPGHAGTGGDELEAMSHRERKP